MAKKDWWTIITIIIVVLIALFILNRDKSVISEESAKCIGNKSVLYIQEGCSHCEIQKEMFGENYKYLKLVDCHYEPEKCIDSISVTPTWIINGKKYSGVQEIKKLKEITGCN